MVPKRRKVPNRTEGFFTIGAEQKDSLLLEPNKRILYKDSLLLAQNRRILYYWRRRGGNFGISSVRQPLIQISAKSTNSRKKPPESGEGNIFGFPGFEGHWSRFQQKNTTCSHEDKPWQQRCSGTSPQHNFGAVGLFNLSYISADEPLIQGKDPYEKNLHGDACRSHVVLSGKPW